MRRPHATPVALIAFCLLTLMPSARAQDAPGAAPPAAPASLAQALVQAEKPQDTVYLAVAAEAVTTPTDGTPSPGEDVPQVADAYGLITQSFGTAAAVAPATMTVLNTDPGTPNPYDGTPPEDALKLLAGSLNDAQWGLLTGSRGLGYGDLTDASQQDFFLALFPGGGLNVQMMLGGGSGTAPPIALTPDALRRARLRLTQQVTEMLQVVGQPDTHAGMGMLPDDATPHYTGSVPPNADASQDTVYGVRVRASVPNVLKPSDLDASTLDATVALGGVRIVGDLVQRLGAAIHTELYADRRYEARSVTLVGPASARAGDLLRALALCVCGAYRKVGPAYVLTDDVQGLGTRQMILARFAQQADIARAGAMADAGDRLYARGGVLSLPSAETGLGITAAERAYDTNKAAYPSPYNSPLVQVPFARLTPQQQDFARQEQQEFQKQRDTNPDSTTSQVSLDGTVMLQPQPQLQLLTPAVPGPVALNINLVNNQLFQPSAKLLTQLQSQWQAQQQAQAPPDPKPAPASPPPPALSTLVASVPRRAVIARPHTAAQVDALIASMRRLGLNQLWLDVFSQGKSLLDDKPADGSPDVLTEALTKTKGTGIAVIPTLDLLHWGTDAPEDAQDLTVLGETSAQDADVQARYSALVDQGMTEAQADALTPTATLSVCPASSSVAQALTALVQRLAATPGVAALALEGTVAPGYDRTPDQDYNGDGNDLGYTVPLRLVCLRRAHVDPVDLSVGVAEPIGQRASVPEFENTSDAWQAMQPVNAQWNALRAEADVDLLRRLLGAAQAAAGRAMPLLVRQRGASWNVDWWGVWADPRAPLPALTQKAIQGNTLNAFAPFAHTQCRVDIVALSAWAAQSPETFADQLRQMKPGWDGFVLDLSDHNGDANPLASLDPPPPSPAMTPKAAARPVGPAMTVTPRLSALLASAALLVVLGGAGGGAAPQAVGAAPPPAPALWSRQAAAQYLDTRQSWWLGWSGASRGQGTACISCHTSLPIALARPALGVADGEMSPGPAEATLISNVRARVAGWNTIVSGHPSAGNGCVAYYRDHPQTSLGTESVMNALVLVNEDVRRAHGTLSAATNAALADLWDQQQSDGSWLWLDFGLSPWEKDGTYYGTALAAIAVGMAGKDYDARTDLQPKIRALRASLRSQFAARPLHDRAVCLWASSWLPGLLSPGEQAALIRQLLTAQAADGGWSLARLGQDASGASRWASQGMDPAGATGDGYATGLVVLALTRAGVGADSVPLRRGLAWLDAHQQSGAWPATYLNQNRDPQTDIGKFMRDSATAFAVLALTEAGGTSGKGGKGVWH